MEVQGVKAYFRTGRILPLLAVICLCASESTAQPFALSGTVRDSSGVVPGATVTVSSAGAQVATTTTDESGNYRFTGLAAGSYELSVSLRGFETVTRNVTVGADTSAVDVVLAAGRVNTSVSVTATAGKATATRLPVPDVDVPAQVSTIPQELILQQGLNTVGDALRNASGVQAIRWYGVYEQYTIRGFFDADRDGFNAVMIDGMRRNGNRYATQANNVEAIEVLKGPSSILYGRGALGGSINIIRKKPQAVRSGDVFYRGGRFNTHQIALGTTGPVGQSDRLLYRTDLSFEASDGWRAAGADRLNVAPSLTWLISPRARLTLHQVFVRDKFDGDGGVPLNIIELPDFRRDANFGLPQDRVLVEDSQTQALFTGRLTSGWELRNSVSVQRTSDKYFVTEGVYGSPDENLVYREPLDFHHIRRPVQNQTEVVGRVSGAGTHNLLFGYEYHRDKYRTEVTAGDDPDCLCGYWWLTIAPMDITTMAETQGPLDIDTVERTTFVNDQTHAFYVQDQMDLTPRIKVNLGYRADNYERDVTRVGGFPFTPQHRAQTAHSYRAGLVFAPRYDQQLYFATSSSFTPVNTVPADGSQLEPSTARNYEVGHRWQGWSGRVDTTAAFYYLVRDNVTIQQSVISFIQVGEQNAKGLDLDVNTDLGRNAFLVFNYGLSVPKFKDAGDLDGMTPRFVPKHNVNLWLRKGFPGGFNGGFGLRYLAAQFGDNENTQRLEDYTIFSGAVGYRRPGWEWSLNAENLFNNDDYFLPGHFGNNAFPGQPINVTTTIRLKWR
jgi:iron complex outermembrane recepter protein